MLKVSILTDQWKPVLLKEKFKQSQNETYFNWTATGFKELDSNKMLVYVTNLLLKCGSQVK